MPLPASSPRPDPREAASAKTGRERRRWPRVSADWPVTLGTPDGRFEARVRDVSQAGVCFFLDRAIEMMTVLAVDLELPVPSGKRLVKTNGVVVRCERISRRIDHYEVAVFFNDIAPPDREALAAYVSARVPDEADLSAERPGGRTQSAGE